MTLLKRIISPKNLIYILFIVLHIFLLNINVAEWGDSYRILRASEYLRNDFTYPDDEKRPPVYSTLLAIRPTFVEPILWGRIFMLVTSLEFLFVFEKFLRLFIKKDKYIYLGMLLLILNPVFLYWSIRIYADVFFALIVLTAIYLFTVFTQKNSKSLSLLQTSLFGIFPGVAALTRFEGYLLFGSLGLGILFYNYSNHKNLWELLKANILKILMYIIFFVIIVLPWFLYRNPFTSTYLEEPAGRAYDLKMIWTYLVSIFFMFGFSSASVFLINKGKDILNILKNNIVITAFILSELLLILVWPAAIPRLFVPIIPFFILFLTLSFENYFEEAKSKTETLKLVISSMLFLGIYIVSQYFLKLQFLIPTKTLFLSLVGLQIISIFFMALKKQKLFLISVLISCFVWSFCIIYIHKDNFISIKNAAEWTSKNINGVVAYNDVSSVSEWYLNEKGYFYFFEKNALLTQESLSKQPLEYLLITNEHNTTLDIDLKKRPYLTLIKEFSYNVNGKMFSTRIVKFERDYKERL